MTVCDLFLRMLSSRPLTEPGDGKAILDLFDEWAPEWAPHRWGFSEPFSPADRERMTAVWGDGIMWYGAGKGQPLVSFFAASSSVHYSILGVSSPTGLVDGERVAALLRALAARTGAVYGFAHRLVEADLASTEPRSASMARLGPSMYTAGTFLAQSGLPNVWWANIFGLPVVELFGADRIATAPAHLVEPLGKDLWYLQLTDSILDNETDFARVEAARAAVKAHLGADAFFDKAKGRSGPYRTIRLPELPPRPAPRSYKIDGFGPEGYTQIPQIRARWETWSRQVDSDLWELVDLPADALTELVEVLPPENRKARVNQIPTLNTFARLASRVPVARFSGKVVGPGPGTEGVIIEQVWVPQDIDDPLLDKIASTADDDSRANGGRILWWT